MRESFCVKMHCASCEKLIEMAVGELEGVKSVKADSKSDAVRVEYSPPATKDLILKAMAQEGFSPAE
jgi:copper chaperone CopZ